MGKDEGFAPGKLIFFLFLAASLFRSHWNLPSFTGTATSRMFASRDIQ